ncbi:hypothetical protein AB0B15_38340 [Streptomyces sp. NPDC045456]|uniref:DUF7848 domain-containing protein n=1 Tax=Streptomyces sp. NPDC045456 TaxID=3155254 RepID=UPI0033DB6D96
MGNTVCYRFRNYTITADKAMLPRYQAVCVTGDDADCGADSGSQPSPADVERWIAEHTRDTGHDLYRRAPWEYVRATAGAWQ